MDPVKKEINELYENYFYPYTQEFQSKFDDYTKEIYIKASEYGYLQGLKDTASWTIDFIENLDDISVDKIKGFLELYLEKRFKEALTDGTDK